MSKYNFQSIFSLLVKPHLLLSWLVIGLIATFFVQVNPLYAEASQLSSQEFGLKNQLNPYIIWYQFEIANQFDGGEVKPIPKYVGLENPPSFTTSTPGWAWLENRNGLTSLMRTTPNGNVVPMGSKDYSEFVVSVDRIGTQVVGLITEFANQIRAFDIVALGEQSWVAQEISMPGLTPSMLRVGRSVSDGLDAKVFALVYDEYDRVYLSYRLERDYSNLISVDFNEAGSQEESELDSTQLQNDLVVADTEGDQVPDSYIQNPIPQASWWRKPLDLQMAVVEPFNTNVPKGDVMLFSVVENTPNNEFAVITTHCQLFPYTHGITHNCHDGVGFLYLRFPNTSQVNLGQPSSIPGWVRLPVIVQYEDGTSEVRVSKYEMMSDQFWYEPRSSSSYQSTGHIDSASLLSLSDTEYMLAVVEDGELSVYKVNDFEDNTAFEKWSKPALSLERYKSVNWTTESNAMVLTAVTTDNVIWKYMTSIPGTVWRP